MNHDALIQFKRSGQQYQPNCYKKITWTYVAQCIRKRHLRSWQFWQNRENTPNFEKSYLTILKLFDIFLCLNDSSDLDLSLGSGIFVLTLSSNELYAFKVLLF